MRVRRRHELANITTLGDVNELAISGHVEHQPHVNLERVDVANTVHDLTDIANAWALP
jgi:hypothetical protein